MSDKPHDLAVRSPEGYWFVNEDDVLDGWVVRTGPNEPWEEPCHSGQWVEARPSGGAS